MEFKSDKSKKEIKSQTEKINASNQIQPKRSKEDQLIEFLKLRKNMLFPNVS